MGLFAQNANQCNVDLTIVETTRTDEQARRSTKPRQKQVRLKDHEIEKLVQAYASGLTVNETAGVRGTSDNGDAALVSTRHY